MRRVRTPLARPPASFADVSEVKVGTVVFDRDSDRPAMVHRIQGHTVTVIRPAGNTWTRPYRRLRPATPAEQDQLDALARFQRVRCKGLAHIS